MILGIDEAGRGPVLGPLVLVGCWLTPRAERTLHEAGVQDSKAFGSSARARERRAELAGVVRRLSRHLVVLVADAGEVDRRVRRGQLNRLEQELATAAIEHGPRARRIVADGARLFGPLRERFPALEAQDGADSSCVAVAAASIVAKVERDRLFEAIALEMAQRLGQEVSGGGYANKATARALEAYVQRFGTLPREVRTSFAWPVLQRLVRGQQRLPLS